MIVCVFFKLTQCEDFVVFTFNFQWLREITVHNNVNAFMFKFLNGSLLKKYKVDKRHLLRWTSWISVNRSSWQLV